jgi:hypothetical protein
MSRSQSLTLSDTLTAIVLFTLLLLGLVLNGTSQSYTRGGDDVKKADILAQFLADARARLAPLGVRTTADVFGLTATLRGTLEVGQQWETLAAVTDVLLPMVYPSHYTKGSFGIARPNAAPFEIVRGAVGRAVERNAAIGITGERVRPYLQAFTLGPPAYGNAELTAQFRATEAAGVNGWILWNPGSKYELFRGALMAATERAAAPETR